MSHEPPVMPPTDVPPLRLNPEILKGAAPLPGLDNIEVVLVQPASTFWKRLAEGLTVRVLGDVFVHVLGDAFVAIIVFAVGLMFGAAADERTSSATSRPEIIISESPPTPPQSLPRSPGTARPLPDRLEAAPRSARRGKACPRMTVNAKHVSHLKGKHAWHLKGHDCRACTMSSGSRLPQATAFARVCAA